ncbi:MAG: hypothetical protein WCY19_06265 [Candidatus Gastranaerophilaceae bacterium]
MRIERSQKMSFKAKVTLIPITKGSENSPLLNPLINKLKRVGDKNIEHIIETYDTDINFITKYPVEDGDVRIKIKRSLFIKNTKKSSLTEAMTNKILEYSKGVKAWKEKIENNKHKIDYPRWKRVFEESKMEFV